MDSDLPALDEKGLALGDIVETAKGAEFWGEIIAFDTDEAKPGCTVLATAPGFRGTKHVYPLAQLRRRASSAPVSEGEALTVDTLAQEIRRVDGDNSHGAGALAEALMPFLTAASAIRAPQGVVAEVKNQLVLLHSLANDTTEANWGDKRLYILQTCVRMGDEIAALEAALATPAPSSVPAGWSVRGAQAYRLFPDEAEAREFAGMWGIVKPVYHGPEVPVHQFTGNGPGVVGADNCQVCGRWSDDPETPSCRDRLTLTPAPSSGEAEPKPVAWITQQMLDDLRANKAVKYRDLVPTRQRDHTIPLYTHPSPSGVNAEGDGYFLQGDVAIGVMASLAAAISLLERSPKTAAPSDKMFDQMLSDYRNSLEAARSALQAQAAASGAGE